MRVLIADDNVDLARSLAEVLRARSAEVDVATDGLAARALAEGHRPDVALLDLKLPGRSGLDLIGDLQDLPRPPGRIIAMTGYDSAERIAAAERIGAETVLRKPFSMDALLGSLGLDAVEAESPPVDCLVLVLGANGGPLPTSCHVVRARDADDLRGQVGDREFDAVVLLGEVGEDLVLDLALLDPDVAVITGAGAALVESAVRQTRGRRRAAAEVRLLDAALRSTPGAHLLVRGRPPRIDRWTPDVEALLGYRPQDLEERMLTRLEQDLDQGPIHALAQRARTDGPLEEVLCVRSRGGAARELRVRAAALTGDAVLLSLRAAPSEDDETRNLEMLGATAAGVAHELRNTLAGVGNSLTVLAGRLEGDEVGVIVEQVRERVHRAAEVMNDLLDFARPVQLRLMAVPAPLVLDAAADQITHDPSVSVVVHVPDPTLRLLVDPVRLQMALINLGNNAAQAMAEVGGTVTLSCESAHDEVHIVVADDGPGVPEPLRARIFDPFFTTRSQGSGLGLANVRKLVEAHGGRVRLLPTERGASFLLALPRRPETTP